MRRARQIRIDRGLSQAQLAEQAGTSVGRIAMFETGHRGLDAATLLDLAEVLQANPRDLLEFLDRPMTLPRVRLAPKTGGRRRGQAATSAA